MKGLKANSIKTNDGIRLVYDVVGEGETIMLLHGGGGGQSRQSWHKAGYVERLKANYKVITMDIRGHGKSDKPTDPSAYTISTHIFPNLTHVQEFNEIDQSFPVMLKFISPLG